jgi:membrane protein
MVAIFGHRRNVAQTYDQQHDRTASAGRDASDDRGRHASTPTEVPARGWLDVAKRVKAEAKTDQVPLLAAGVAFFALLALVPALVALISLYGLVADPEDITTQVDDALAAAPTEVRDMIGQQLSSIEGSSGGAVIAVIGGVLLALWSASSGMGHLIDAINVAYDEEETRGFVKLRVLGLCITAGGLLVIVASLLALTVLPAVGDQLGDGGRLAASILRWPLLAAVGVIALGALYRYAPDRDDAKWEWVTPGALTAVVIWLLGSVAFTIYANQFGSFGETYGALGAVVVVMLWLFITAMAVLIGAEINGEAERQTTEDTTVGAERRLGRRDAYAADTVGSDA